MNGAQIRMARAALKMGVRDLAAAAEVSPNTITRVEADQPVNASTLGAIRRALEAAGVEFTNGERPGVRMKAPISDSEDVIEYRGYVLTPTAYGGGWHVGIGRTVMSLPQMISLEPLVSMERKEDAIAEAKRRIDRMIPGNE